MQVKPTRRGQLAAALLACVVLTGCATASASTNPPGAVNSACAGSITGTDAQLSPEQSANVKIIAETTLGLGLGRPGVLLAILTANVETDLRNLPGGDRDSVGLFQQRAPWGSFEERHDPATATTMFWKGGRTGQPGMLSITGWETMSPEIAMQATQQSQYSQRPGDQSPGLAGKLAMAQRIVASIMGDSTTTCPAGGNRPAPTGVTMNLSQNPPDYGWVHGGPLEPLVWQGHKFGSVAAGTAKLWTAMLDELVPRIPGGLNGNLGCFADRANVNNPSRLSLHAYGLACDINYDANCNGCAGYGRTGTYVLPPETHDIAAKWGYVWGGDFTGTPDPMHLEVHITPGQVAAIVATL
jgi:D-alanyl-D-alanine carboxypeptidase-like protein